MKITFIPLRLKGCENLELFRIGKKHSAPGGAAAVQTSSASRHPYSSVLGTVALCSAENRVYSALREAVPIIDAAIGKTVRLAEGFSVDAHGALAQRELDAFFKGVNVGGTQTGIMSFVSLYLDQLLTYGTAVGEMVVSGGQLIALYNGELETLEVKRAQNSLDVEFYNRTLHSSVPLKNPELILYSVLNPMPGKMTGTSLLRGLPFISDILLKIYNTIGTNWERVGNLRYAVTYKPQGDVSDKTLARDRANMMAKQWQEAMQSKETVKDFVAVGDVSVKVIGADNQILDSEIPVRQLLEQIVAKTGLPPFVFGLNWSSTERMSTQQADILTTELESYRRVLTPVIEKIANTFLLLNGYSPSAEVIWNDITLQDETQLAQARLYEAQAKQIETEEC